MGFITYHRTDSTRVSDAGIAVAKEWISEKFGEELFVPRRWGEGGAHEAIRPTRPLSSEELKLEFAVYGVDYVATRLYDLIFRRFMASQMKEAKVKGARIEYDVLGIKVVSERLTEVVEEGWTAVWKPKLVSVDLSQKEPEVVEAKIRRASKTSLPRVYEVLRWMKENRIGRPSTYAKTIENLRRHGYVVLTPRSYVVATKKGLEVERCVDEVFPELLSASYTRKLEELMDLAKTNVGEALKGVTSSFRGLASVGT
jgi:reverse gyrase